MLLVLHKTHEFVTVYGDSFVTINSRNNVSESQCLLVLDVVKAIDNVIQYKVFYKGKIRQFMLFKDNNKIVDIYV